MATQYAHAIEIQSELDAVNAALHVLKRGKKQEELDKDEFYLFTLGKKTAFTKVLAILQTYGLAEKGT